MLLPTAVVDEMEATIYFYKLLCGTITVFHLIHDSSRQQYWFDNN